MSNAIQTTSDRLYTHLKQDVTTCALAPGAPVSEGELCRRYRASRTPVREACRRLEREGLITIVPFRGYFIAPLTLVEYQNLHEVQLIIEPSAAALAAQRASPSQLRAIETAGKYEYRVGQRNSYYTFLQRNFDLHVGIAEASQNEHLVEVTTAIQTRLMRYFYLIIAMDAFGPDLVNEHEKIISAIRARSPDLARERAAEHVRKTIERSARLFLQSTRFRLGNSGIEGTNLMKLDLEMAGAFDSDMPEPKKKRIRTRAKNESGVSGEPANLWHEPSTRNKRPQ
jgi:DNA-binding GntR family transcriptional regulator